MFYISKIHFIAKQDWDNSIFIYMRVYSSGRRISRIGLFHSETIYFILTFSHNYLKLFPEKFSQSELGSYNRSEPWISFFEDGGRAVGCGIMLIRPENQITGHNFTEKFASVVVFTPRFGILLLLLEKLDFKIANLVSQWVSSYLEALKLLY